VSRRSVLAIFVVAVALAALVLGEKLWPAPVAPPAATIEVRPPPVKPPDDPRCPCPPGTTQRRRESQFKRGAVELWCVDGRGMREGPNRSWSGEGQLEEDIPYRDGVPEGIAVYWHPNGQIMCKSPHRDGKLHGVDRCWHPNGKLKSEVRFDMDRAVGIGRYWDERGHLVRKRDFAKDPLPIPESTHLGER
jgi:hypothetical protein